MLVAVLVHPRARPAWLSDQPVIDAARPNMPARFGISLLFRHNGHGWRYVSVAFDDGRPNPQRRRSISPRARLTSGFGGAAGGWSAQ